MADSAHDLVQPMRQEAAEPLSRRPSPPVESATIHYSELPEAQPDSPLYHEWNYYRQAVGRLLADGQEGRYVLIKGEETIGIWNTGEEAKKVALERYLMQPCLIHQIRSHEPLLRVSTRIRR